MQSGENWSAIVPQASVKNGPDARYAALIVAAAVLASGALIYAALGDWALLALFTAGLIGIATIIALFRHFYPPVVEAEYAMPDWSVTHAATEHDSIAIAITDEAGRLTCANSRFVTLFGAKNAPPNIALHNNGTDYLAEAGREAWREGRGFAEGLTTNGVTYEAEVSRIGRGQAFLMWRIAPVVQTDMVAEANRLLAGKPGRALANSGLMGVLIGPEGRIRAANSAFSERASGAENSNITGRDFAQFLRADEKNRIFFEREGRRGSPLRLLHIPLVDPAVDVDVATKAKAAALILILDQDHSAIDRTTALGYVQTLLSLLPIGLAMTDRDGRFLFANAAFARASNISEEDMPPYPGDLVVGEDKGALADAVRRRASGQTQTGDVTIRLKGQPDEPVALSLASVRGMGDAAVLLSLKDSSEEAKLKRQVAQASKMQAVGQLAGGVAHDFNNVLTAIIGHCDLMLMRHSPGDSDYDDIQQIKSNSNRAAGLTRQLLAFSRQQTLRPQVLQLPDIVAEVSNLLQRLLGEKITLEINHDRDLGSIRADPGQLEQVIVNLAVNARDAMLSGKKAKGTLKISTKRITASDVRAMGSEILPPEDYSALLVEDDGMGMPPDVQAKIFEPFFTTKEVGKGTGLGLSTVYGIVKQSGGYIFVDSVPGKSTVFTIYFPVFRGFIGETTPAKKPPPPRNDEQWGNAKLLLVEDEDMVRAVAERALARQGYTVITASDGEDGLARFEDSGPFDLVVSDVVMPNMDGPAMAAQLRQRAPDLPILFMSGYAEEQLRQTISLDQVHFLPKPFSVAQIVDAVRSAIAQ